MMNNIESITREYCAGCTSCANSCPTQCISMQEDVEGYLYPQINKEGCIDCSLCLDACPANKDIRSLIVNETSQLYAVQFNSDYILQKSSSGGAFSAISNWILDKKGAICGVAYNSSFTSCFHLTVKDEEKLDLLRRSKFVQSVKKQVFQEIKQLLDEGKYVLFTGCPCEVAGLKSYLSIDYTRLYTCDLICGCVSSPKVFRVWTQFLTEKYKGYIVDLNFKDKRNGWKAKGVAVQFSNGEEYHNSLRDDDYVVSFHSRFNIRPSCFNCKYAQTERVADFTIGDFWGIKDKYPELDNDKGTSFVLVNSKKGYDLLQELSVYLSICLCDWDLLEYGRRYNSRLISNPDNPISEENRRSFYEELGYIDFETLSKKYLSEIKRQRKEYFEKMEKNKQ